MKKEIKKQKAMKIINFKRGKNEVINEGAARTK